MRKKGLFIVGIILLGVIWIVRVVARQHFEDQSIQQENNEEIEDTIWNQIVDEGQTVEENGNIFRENEHIKYGGFGYEVLDFWLCDSYDDIISNPEYKEEGILFPFKHETSEYAGAKVLVTNETLNEMRYYCNMNIFAAKDEKIIIDERPEIYWDGHLVYIGGFEFDTEDFNNRRNPILEAGKSITLLLYFEYDYAVEEPDGNYSRVRLEDIVDNPEYYLRIEGTISGDDGRRINDIKNDRRNIYIQCYPKGDGE